MRQLVRTCGLMVALLMLVSVGTFAVRWSPGELDVFQDPGTVETISLVLQNDSNEAAQVRLYVADWLRDENGTNDFGVPKNGARWELDRPFSAGESVILRYTVRLPDSLTINVQGSFRSWIPQTIDHIGGATQVDVESIGTSSPAVTSELVSLTRSVESIDASGLATIELELRTAAAFDGLTVEEIYEINVELSSLDAAGGQFTTINRSCADWVTLSHELVRLEPEEAIDITMTLATPEAFSGMYWCILMAESEDIVVGEVRGTRIVSRPSVGLKLFVSAPGTLDPSGSTTGIDVVDLNPLTVDATFSNEGNAQLLVTAEAQIVSQTGAVIRAMRFTEYGRDYFRILPGSQRTLAIVDLSEAAPLPAGVYQAIVSFDFGGDSLIAGVKAFRVR